MNSPSAGKLLIDANDYFNSVNAKIAYKNGRPTASAAFQKVSATLTKKPETWDLASVLASRMTVQEVN